MGPKPNLRFHLGVLTFCISYVVFANAHPAAAIASSGLVHSNTSSLSADPSGSDTKDYIVTPKEPGNIPMASTIDRRMAAIVSRSSIFPFNSPRTGVEFWVVTATDSEAQELSRIPNVSVVGQGEDSVVTAKSDLRPQ